MQYNGTLSIASSAHEPPSDMSSQSALAQPSGRISVNVGRENLLHVNQNIGTVVLVNFI